MRREALELLLPRLDHALKRRYWNQSWSAGSLRLAATPWFLPEGVVPRAVRQALEAGWFPSGARVLDIGCGIGEVSAYVAAAGFDVLGVDYAAPAIQRARERFGASRMLRFEVLDICRCVPSGAPFDVLIDRGCYHGLSVRSRQRYLRSVVACSRSGAHFLMMHFVSLRTDLASSERIRLREQTMEKLDSEFSAYFNIEHNEPIVFNRRGDDEERGSVPGVALWMARR